MKPYLLLTTLIFSALSANAQNLTNIQAEDQTASVTNVYTFNNDINPSYQQYANNTVDIQVQGGNNGSSALQSFGNSGNRGNRGSARQIQQNNTNKPQVQTNVNNIGNRGGINEDDNVSRGNRGNFNEIALDNNVGSENRGRGGNIIVNDIQIQSNPVVNNKKTVANKPEVKEYQGLDFKPSGLSGRDYNSGGKLKKGQKNFYSPSATKHKTVHKKKPHYKKVKHHTSKCAKW